jgi:hypothetical protein
MENNLSEAVGRVEPSRRRDLKSAAAGSTHPGKLSIEPVHGPIKAEGNAAEERGAVLSVSHGH